MRTIATVGVYPSSLDDFLETLARHQVVMVVDVRQRRGVRSREYAWANSLRPQAALKQAGIQYRHVPDARACHRSLIAARIHGQYGVPVSDL